MKTALLLVVAMALAACATPGKFRDKMNGFVGQNELVVVSNYGAPQSTYTGANGARVISYTRGGPMTLPGSTTYEPVTSTTNGQVTLQQGMKQTSGNYTAKTTTAVPVQAAPTTIMLSCTVHFTINPAGVVESWRAEGNNCVSSG